MGHQHPTAAVPFTTKLVHGVTVFSPISAPYRMGSANKPLGDTILKKPQVALPQVSDDLRGTLTQAVAMDRIYRAFPHEKQRTGMIIW